MPSRLVLICTVSALSLAIASVAIGRVATPPKPPNGQWTLDAAYSAAEAGFTLKRGKHKERKYQFASNIHAEARPAGSSCPDLGTPLKVLGKFRLRAVGSATSSPAWAVGKYDPQAQGRVGTIPAKVKVKGSDPVGGRVKITFSSISPRETFVNEIDIPGASGPPCVEGYSDGSHVHK